MSAEWRPARFSSMSMVRVDKQPHFGQKQVHTISRKLINTKVILYTLVADQPSQNDEHAQETKRACVVKDIIAAHGGTIIELQVQNGREPHIIWKTAESVGLAPFSDGTWSASGYISFGSTVQGS